MKHWFADLKAFRHDPLAFILERGNASDDPLARLRIGVRPVFLVADPGLIKPILRWNEAEIDKGRFIRKLRPAFGNSSLSMSGPEHRRRRSVLHTRMARGAALTYLPQISAAIRQVAANLAGEESFDAHRITSILTLRLVCIALFGHQVLSSGDEQAMVEAVHLLEVEIEEDMFRVIPLGPRSRLKRKRNLTSAQHTMSVIVQSVRKNTSGDSVLSALEKLGLSDIEIRDEIVTMLLAGHHTTAGAAVWLLYYLATQPGLIEKIGCEARTLSNEAGEIEPARLKDASVSLALVREVLRLYPSAWWFSREIMRPVTLGGIRLRRGTSLIISPWQIHRDPRNWDQPETFRLNRTYGGNAYLPFGAGPRACVGMGVAILELQLLALEMASAYQLTICGQTPLLKLSASVTLVPPPITIRLRARHTVKQPCVVA